VHPSLNITTATFQFAPWACLPADEVQVWRVDLHAVADAESRWQPLLSADEMARAQRFRFSRNRQHFTAVRALLRIALGAYLARDPKDLAFSYSKQGKPALAFPDGDRGLNFNLSHSGEVALLAFARGRQVGIDVEKLRANLEVETLVRRFFSLREREQLAAVASEDRYQFFFRCWTRKEAYLKAAGTGLSLPLHEFDVSLALDNTDALLRTRPEPAEAARWSLREVPAGPGYVAALCVEGRGWQLKEWSSADT
jgi:4'-phosphopantetheinyl transferase